MWIDKSRQDGLPRSIDDLCIGREVHLVSYLGCRAHSYDPIVKRGHASTFYDPDISHGIPNTRQPTPRVGRRPWTTMLTTTIGVEFAGQRDDLACVFN